MYQNQMIGSKVTAIFFNGQKFLNGGVVSKGSVRSLQGRLVVVYSIQTGFIRKMAQICWTIHVFIFCIVTNCLEVKLQ